MIKDNFSKAVAKAAALLNEPRAPSGKKKIGTCLRCGGAIFGYRTKGARYCSATCRNAAYRKRKPPVKISALHADAAWARAGEAALQKEVAALREENEKLRQFDKPLAADHKRLVTCSNCGTKFLSR